VECLSQVRFDGPEAAVMTVTLYDTSGQSPVSLGAATVPIGGDLEEGFVKLKLKGAYGRQEREDEELTQTVSRLIYR